MSFKVSATQLKNAISALPSPVGYISSTVRNEYKVLVFDQSPHVFDKNNRPVGPAEIKELTFIWDFEIADWVLNF